VSAETPGTGLGSEGAAPGGPEPAETLKLTTYFGERDRTPDGLLGDVLVGLYARHGVRASVLLRGAEGFGRLHHLSTDRLLSSSEDLPVVSVAIDERVRIEALLASVLEVKRRGLITLERARLLAGAPAGAPALSVEDGHDAKLTVFLGRQDRAARAPAHVALCELLHRGGMAGASVLLGVDGTLDGRRLRARFFSRNAQVPLLVTTVGGGARIAALLPEIEALLGHPLMTLERVRVCKRDGENLADPHELTGTDEHGLALWQKLTVHSSHAATADGLPLHLQLVRRLQAQTRVAGATVLRGVWGFHGDHPPHGDRVFQIRRHVPVVTTVIDTPERIAEAYSVVDEVTDRHGLVTSEVVPAAQAISEERRRGGLRLARPGR
jgi:PII-like signaling protein